MYTELDFAGGGIFNPEPRPPFRARYNCSSTNFSASNACDDFSNLSRNSSMACCFLACLSSNLLRRSPSMRLRNFRSWCRFIILCRILIINGMLCFSSGGAPWSMIRCKGFGSSMTIFSLWRRGGVSFSVTGVRNVGKSYDLGNASGSRMVLLAILFCCNAGSLYDGGTEGTGVG